MSARSIGTGTIQFGLVTIPFKIYTATSAKRVGFTSLHKACGQPLKQQRVCPSDGGAIVDRDDTVRGFEVAKGQYVRFTDKEIEALEVSATKALRLEEFVSRDAVDFLSIEKTYFIGPDDTRSARPYRLLSLALEEEGALGVGRFAQRGRDNLVLVRPHQRGLVLHECFYADEIRSFEDVEIAATGAFSPEEIEYSRLLIRQYRRESFDTGRYRDEWYDSVQDAVRKKIAGEEIVRAPLAAVPPVIDLLEALRRSVAANETKLEAETLRRDELRREVETTRGPVKAAPRDELADQRRRIGTADDDGRHGR